MKLEREWKDLRTRKMSKSKKKQIFTGDFLDEEQLIPYT
jgi:hypothetical protein